MMLGDAIGAALTPMRAHAESLMIETCDVHRPVSEWDEALQKTVTTWSLVTSVPCYVGDAEGNTRVLITDQSVTPVSPVIHTPWTTGGVQANDRVTHSSGAVMWVTDVPLDPYPVERILICRWVK